MLKLLYIVLDGAADELEESSSLDNAYTPNLDEIAKRSMGGMHYPVGKGIAPESDAAVLNLLGYDCEKYYTGRGPIEALGVGMSLKEDFEIAFRGNLATADFEKGIIVDRRVGRDITTREAKQLLKGLEFIDLGIYDGYAKMKVGLDYRVAVIIGSRKHKLSHDVSNTDPAYIKSGSVSVAKAHVDNKIRVCEPLSESEEAKITAELVNKFIEIINKRLAEHPINKRRERTGRLPANTILLRDAGMRPPDVPSMKKMYGVKFKMIADMPTELGVARLLGIGIVKCPKPKYIGEIDYPIRAKKALETLQNTIAVYIHLKGPDIYGHDKNKEGKIKSIEEIDKYFISKILDEVDLDKTAILITMDHATPPSRGVHTGDPVPFTVYVPGRNGDGLLKFSEREVYSKGSLGILGYGWMIMPIIKKLIWN